MRPVIIHCYNKNDFFKIKCSEKVKENENGEFNALIQEFCKNIFSENKNINHLVLEIKNNDIRVCSSKGEQSVENESNSYENSDSYNKLIKFINEKSIFIPTFSLYKENRPVPEKIAKKETKHIIKQIKNFFRCYSINRFIKNNVNKELAELVKDKLSSDSKKTLDEVWDEVYVKLVKKYPKALSLFTQDEIEILIKNQILEFQNKKLVAEGKPKINDLQAFEVINIINYAKERSNTELALNELLKRDGLEIPIEKLKAIPMKDNLPEEKIIAFWDKLIVKLFTEGSLEQIDLVNLDRDINTNTVLYLEKYLEALASVPPELWYKLNNIIELNAKKNMAGLSDLFKNNSRIKNKYLEKRIGDLNFTVDKIIKYSSLNKKIRKKYKALTFTEKNLLNKKDVKNFVVLKLNEAFKGKFLLNDRQIEVLNTLYQNQEAGPTFYDELYSEEIISEIRNSPPVYSWLPSDQQADLVLLTRFLKKAKSISKNKEGEISLEDKERFTHLIKKLSKDPKIDAIRKKSSKSQLPTAISMETLEFLKAYKKKIAISEKKMLQTEHAIAKATALLDESCKSPTNDMDKLTLKELGLISDLRRFREVDLLKMLWVNKEDKTEKIIKMADLSRKIIKELNKKIQSSEYLKGGEILVHKQKKKEAWTGKKGSLEDRIASLLCSGSTHGGKIYKADKIRKIRISEIWSEYQHDSFNIYKICTCDIWELDIFALMNKDIKVVLENIYGANEMKLEEHMYKSYREIENDILPTHRNIENNYKRRVAAGLARFHLLLNLFFIKIKGHKLKEKKSRQKLYDQFMGKDADKSETKIQICSEFAAKTTIVSVMKLNNQIIGEIHDRTRERFSGINILRALRLKEAPVTAQMQEFLEKGTPLEKKEEKELKLIIEKYFIPLEKEFPVSADFLIQLNKKELFKLPYGKKERLKAIHPGRMVNALLRKNYIRKKEPPPELTAIINFNSF